MPNSRLATPGPGAYEQKVHGKTAPRGVMCPRRPDSAPVRGRGTPGPGQYQDVLSHKRSAPKYKIGTAVAREGPNKDLLRSPAPNAYSPTRDQTLNKNPSWAIGNAQRRPLSSREPNPGPGTYSQTLNQTAPSVILFFKI